MVDFGVPTAGQLEKINALAKRTLSKDEVFAFNAKLAGDMIIPGRYIQLSKPLLNVFKQNAIEGVAFLLDHSWSGFGRPKAAIPYGRTFDAKLQKSDVDGEQWALNADHYIVRGIEIDNISTDSIIQSIEAGTMFDTSIGWGAQTLECSICGKDYRDYSQCQHFGGEEYDGKLCYAIAKPPGFLMENSAVFDGVYPTAGVLSQMGAGENEPGGMILVENIKELPLGVTAYHAFSSQRGKLFTYAKKDDLAKGNVFTVPDLSNLKGSDNKVSDDLLKMLTGLGITVAEGTEAPASEVVLKMLSEKWQKENPPADPPAAPEAYMTQAQAVEKLGKELPADKVLSYAKEGMAYRAELVEEALKAGVRAQADAFKKETWERNFELMSVQDIKDTMDTWQKQAKDEIPAGRQSSSLSQQTIAQTLPDDAFKVGR